MTPTVTTRGSSPCVSVSHQHISQEDASTIDSVISNTSSNNQPPMDQSLVSGKDGPLATDEEIDHDQLAVDFVLE